MMAEEKIYTIPLREAFKKARAKRVPYAVRTVQNYIKMHAKVGDVKLGSHLNEALWKRSIKKPPRRLRVKVVKDGDIAKAELVGFEYVDFKAKPKTEKKGMRERLVERLGPKAQQKEELEKTIEGKKPESEEKKPESKTEKKEEAKPGQKEAPKEEKKQEPKKEAKPEGEAEKKEEAKKEAPKKGKRIEGETAGVSSTA